MTDRDHFAAAALTGLLANEGDFDDHHIHEPCRRAYAWADAMLRERDLSRAGQIAQEARESGEKCTDGESVPENDHLRHVSQTCRVAEPMPEEKRAEVSFTLTDEEREAIAHAADLLIGSRPGATLRSLLARLGG